MSKAAFVFIAIVATVAMTGEVLKHWWNADAYKECVRHHRPHECSGALDDDALVRLNVGTGSGDR